MKRSCLLCLALLLLLSSCAPTAAVTPSPVQTSAPTATPPPSPTEPPSPWMEDYDMFWRVVEENYSCYAAAQRITGVDFQALKEEHRATVLKTEDSSGLYSALYKCTKAFEYTGHLRMFDDKWYAMLMNSSHDSTDAKNRYHYELLDNPQSRALYHYEEPRTPRGTGGTRSRGESTASASGNLIFMEYPESSAVYVEILSMNSTDEAKDWAEMVAFFTRAQAEGYQNCIVDIRRNGGGTSNYGVDMVVAPNRTEPGGMEHYALVRGGKELLDYLDVVKDWLPLHPIEELPTDTLPALNPDDLALATHYFVLTVGPKNGKYRVAEPLFTGRFWLLTSPRVYSASEYLAAFCKDTGFATLVGEPTGGDGVGINPSIHVLPNSGICFQFSAENGLNLDGSCNEEFGTAPDILIEEGQDALQICLETIDKTQ